MDFLAYALFAYEKSGWVSHFEAKSVRLPNQDEVDAWIVDITTYQFDGMRQKAADLFDAAARAYMRDEIEGIQERALNSAIVAEVKAAGVWWKQFLMAVAMAIWLDSSSAASSFLKTATAATRRRRRMLIGLTPRERRRRRHRHRHRHRHRRRSRHSLRLVHSAVTPAGMVP